MVKKAKYLENQIVNVETPDRGIGPGTMTLLLSHPSKGEKEVAKDIVWLDTYYQRPEGQGHADAGIVGLPCVLLNAVNNDEPAVSASIGDDKVLINDIDKEQVEGAC